MPGDAGAATGAASPCYDAQLAQGVEKAGLERRLVFFVLLHLVQQEHVRELRQEPQELRGGCVWHPAGVRVLGVVEEDLLSRVCGDLGSS